MSRLVYFTRETWISLRRNLLMTLAGVMTVAVSLTLFGGIWLVQRLVDHGTSRWKNGVELEIFMNVDANQQQIDAVQAELDGLDRRRAGPRLPVPRASRTRTRSSSGSSTISPRSIESTTAEALPTSFRVAPTEAELTAGRRRPVRGGARRRRGAHPAGPDRPHHRGHPLHPVGLHRDGRRAARLVAVPHHEHDPPRDVRPPPRDRGHEARRRVELVRPHPVHGRGARAGRDRRRLRVRAHLRPEGRAQPASSRTAARPCGAASTSSTRTPSSIGLVRPADRRRRSACSAPPSASAASWTRNSWSLLGRAG